MLRSPVRGQYRARGKGEGGACCLNLRAIHVTPFDIGMVSKEPRKHENKKLSSDGTEFFAYEKYIPLPAEPCEA